MMDQDCVWKYAEYSTFYVESDSFKYRLNITGYSGDAGTYAILFYANENKTRICSFRYQNIDVFKCFVFQFSKVNSVTCTT